MEVSGQLYTPAALPLGKEPLVPLKRLGGPQSQSGHGGEKFPAPSTVPLNYPGSYPYLTYIYKKPSEQICIMPWRCTGELEAWFQTFLTLTLDRAKWSASHQYPLYRTVGGPHNQSGQGNKEGKFLPLLGIKPWSSILQSNDFTELYQHDHLRNNLFDHNGGEYSHHQDSCDTN